MKTPVSPAAGLQHYRLHGLTLASSIPLPELESVRAEEPVAASDVRVQLSPWRSTRPESVTPFMTWTRPTGEPWLTFSRTTGGYLLRFLELADFYVNGHGRLVMVSIDPETPPHTLRHLFLDQVLPLVLTLHGREALHATAVLTPLGVCAFMGPASVGKSTLAASFLTAGYHVVSDDCLGLDEQRGRIVATPAYPGLRLWDDTVEVLYVDSGPFQRVSHYSSKQRLVPRVPPVNFSRDLHPMIRIYALVRPKDEEEGKEGRFAGPLITRLSPRDGLMELISSAFRLDITDRSMLIRQFDFFERVASLIPVRRLRMPHRFSFLPVIREAILADLAAQ